LKCVQNRSDLTFDPRSPGTLGANDRAQGSFGFLQFPVDQNIIVIRVIPNLFGRIPQPPRNHIVAIFAPRAEPLLQNLS
jgi:hypothetical protein